MPGASGRIQLRSDLLNWEPTATSKSSGSTLNPHRATSSSAYVPPAPPRGGGLDNSMSSNSSSYSYMEPMRSSQPGVHNSYNNYRTAPGPNPRNLLSSSSQSSMAYSEYAPPEPTRPRLRRQPSVLLPERRVRIASADILDLDVSEIVSGTYRETHKTETSFTLEPRKSFRSTYVITGDFDRTSMLEHSLNFSQTHESKLGDISESLLDWDINDAIAHSATPRGSFNQMDQFNEGILTYQQKVTSSASMDVFSHNRQYQRGSNDNGGSHAYRRSSPLSPNDLSGLDTSTSANYYSQVPLSPKATLLNPTSENDPRRSTSPLSPVTATRPPKRGHSHGRESTGDWLSDLQRTMGLMEGRSEIKRIQRKDLSSPVKERSPAKKPAGLEDNADLPSWQRVLLQRQRDKYEQEELAEQIKNSSPPKPQQGKPVLNRYQPNAAKENLMEYEEEEEEKYNDQENYQPDEISGRYPSPAPMNPYSLSGKLPPASSYSLKHTDWSHKDSEEADYLNQSTVERTPLRDNDQDYSHTFSRTYGLGPTIQHGAHIPYTPATLPPNESSRSAYTPTDNSFTFSPSNPSNHTQGYDQAIQYRRNNWPPSQPSSHQYHGNYPSVPAPNSRDQNRKWNARSTSPSSPRARAMRSLQSYKRSRQVRRAVLGSPGDEDEFAALASETQEMISKLSDSDPSRREAHMSLIRLLEKEQPKSTEEQISILENNLAISDEPPSSNFQSKVRRIAAQFENETRFPIATGSIPGAVKSPRKGLIQLQANVRRKLADQAVTEQIVQITSPSSSRGTGALGNNKGVASSSPYHRRKVMSEEQAATVLQCAYRKVTAERVVLEKLMEVLGDANWGSDAKKSNQGESKEKAQAVILEGQHWSALILARAASPLPMPGISADLRHQLAEQYHRYIDDTGGEGDINGDSGDNVSLSSPVRTPSKDFLNKLRQSRSLSGGNVTGSQPSAAMIEHPSSKNLPGSPQMASWQKEALFAREQLRLQELNEVHRAQREAEEEAQSLMRESEMGLSPRQKRSVEQLRARLEKEEEEAAEALKKVRSELIAAGLREPEVVQTRQVLPPVSEVEPSQPVVKASKSLVGQLFSKQDETQPSAISTPSVSLSMTMREKNQTTTLDRLLDDGDEDGEVDMDEETETERAFDDAILEDEVSNASEAVYSVKSSVAATNSEVESVKSSKKLFEKPHDKLKQHSEAAAKRIEEKMRADREARKLKKLKDEEEARKKKIEEEEKEEGKQEPQPQTHQDRLKQHSEAAAKKIEEKMRADREARKLKQKQEAEAAAVVVAKEAEVTAAANVETSKEISEEIPTEIEQPRDEEEYNELIDEDVEDEEGEYEEEEEGAEYREDRDETDSNRFSAHSVASIVIPEDEEIDYEISEYEMTRQDEFTEKLDHQKDGHPLALGSFAKALFDNDEHWYPCMVIGRDRDPECIDSDIHFVYTVEFFDGDVKEGIPEPDIAYISPEEAQENMRELEEEQEEAASHEEEEEEEGEDIDDRGRDNDREGDDDRDDDRPITIDREEEEDDEEVDMDDEEEEEDFIDNDVEERGYSSKGEESVGDASRKRSSGGGETPDMSSEEEEEEDEVEFSPIVVEENQEVQEEVDLEKEEEANAMEADEQESENEMARRMAEDSLRISSDLRLSSASGSRSRGPSLEPDQADISALTEATTNEKEPTDAAAAVVPIEGSDDQYDVDDETAELLSAQAMQRLGKSSSPTKKRDQVAAELETVSSSAGSNNSSSPRRASASSVISSQHSSNKQPDEFQAPVTTPNKRHSTGSLPRDHEEGGEGGSHASPNTQTSSSLLSPHPITGSLTPLKSPLSLNSLDSGDPNDPVVQAMKAYRRLSSRSPAPNHGGLRKSIDTLLRNSSDIDVMSSGGTSVGSNDSALLNNAAMTHERTRVTDSPNLADLRDVDKIKAATKAATQSLGIKPGTDQTPLEQALPEGWAEVMTEDGTPYYWHKSTNEVTWDKPSTTNEVANNLFQPVSGDEVIEDAEDEVMLEGEEGDYVDDGYADGDLSEDPYLSDDPQALSTVEEGDETESISRIDSSVLGRVTPDAFEDSEEEEEEGSIATTQKSTSIKQPIRSESFGRNSEGGGVQELEQESVDQMLDFLSHAGLEGYAEVFMQYGFGSVDDLLNPDLVRDEDLVSFCGMSEEEVLIFRTAVNAVNEMSEGEEEEYAEGEEVGEYEEEEEEYAEGDEVGEYEEGEEEEYEEGEEVGEYVEGEEEEYEEGEEVGEYVEGEEEGEYVEGEEVGEYAEGEEYEEGEEVGEYDEEDMIALQEMQAQLGQVGGDDDYEEDEDDAYYNYGQEREDDDEGTGFTDRYQSGEEFEVENDDDEYDVEDEKVDGDVYEDDV